MRVHNAVAFSFVLIVARTASQSVSAGDIPETGTCSEHGAILCNGERYFGQCDWGTIVWKPTSESVCCRNGEMNYCDGTRSTAATTSTATPSTPSCYNESGPTVRIGAGVVQGTTTSLSAATATVNKYLGIPFAQSPPLRFAPPESVQASGQTINATAFKPACIQQFAYPELVAQFTKLIFNNPAPEESEDCLYLNVYAPSSPAPCDGRAVLVWIYGFASSPELPIDERNLGFLDQRAALDWVQREIHHFGGSPDKVTIFGESAGARSVDALLTSYDKDDKVPFRGATLQSGQSSYRAQPQTSTYQQWDQLAAALNCSSTYNSNLTCIRAATATTIKTIIEQQILRFNPTLDNTTLYANAAQRRADGLIPQIPVMGGTNSKFSHHELSKHEHSW